MVSLNHKHMIVNAVIANAPKEGSEKFIVEWLNELVKAVGMKVVIGPHAHYCQADGNNGITASVNIETSHASLHIWDKTVPPILRFDLYSCSDYDVNTVLNFIKGFDPLEIEYMVIDRNDTHMKVSDWTQMKDFLKLWPQHLVGQSPPSLNVCTTPEVPKGSQADHRGIHMVSASGHTIHLHDGHNS